MKKRIWLFCFVLLLLGALPVLAVAAQAYALPEFGMMLSAPTLDATDPYILSPGSGTPEGDRVPPSVHTTSAPVDATDSTFSIQPIMVSYFFVALLPFLLPAALYRFLFHRPPMSHTGAQILCVIYGIVFFFLFLLIKSHYPNLEMVCLSAIWASYGSYFILLLPPASADAATTEDAISQDDLSSAQTEQEEPPQPEPPQAPPDAGSSATADEPAHTKLCPRCGRAIPAFAASCPCGFQYARPKNYRPYNREEEEASRIKKGEWGVQIQQFLLYIWQYVMWFVHICASFLSLTLPLSLLPFWAVIMVFFGLFLFISYCILLMAPGPLEPPLSPKKRAASAMDDAQQPPPLLCLPPAPDTAPDPRA